MPAMQEIHLFIRCLVLFPFYNILVAFYLICKIAIECLPSVYSHVETEKREQNWGA